MRLINTKTYEPSEFFDDAIPDYAILSHRWGVQEMSFKEISSSDSPLKDTSTAFSDKHAGIRKVVAFCRLCAQNKLDWCWVDTCCINKDSSAELSEAINSMFKWYAHASICCVYLADVYASDEELSEMKSRYQRDHNHRTRLVMDWPSSLKLKFYASSWFERGWTLQELLAPSVVQFFSCDWRQLGTKFELATELAEITRVEQDDLRDPRHLSDNSVATKMSWAAKRKTTRGEDLAYCLLGLFNVNMPLLYGEGPMKAFRRLQLEIMSISDDESLFAWWETPLRGGSQTGLLAELPIDFSASGGIVPDVITSKLRKPFAITSKGIEAHIPEIAFAGQEKLLNDGNTRTHEIGCLTLACYRFDLAGDPVQVAIVKTRTGPWVRYQGEMAFPRSDFGTLEHDLKRACRQVYIASARDHNITSRRTVAWDFKFKDIAMPQASQFGSM